MLAITASFFTNEKAARRALLRNETLRGISTDISIQFWNIGASFGGGIVESYSLESLQMSVSTTVHVALQIPQLVPDEKSNWLKLGQLYPLFEGSAWLIVRMKAGDGLPIDTYQAPNTPSAGTDEWRTHAYIANREDFMTYLTVQRLAQRRKRSQK